MNHHDTTHRSFTLGSSIDTEQRAFFDEHGYLHFPGFASQEQVEDLRAALAQVNARLVAQDRKRINGIPIRYGHDLDGRKMVQRFAFTSLLSDELHDFINGERFAPIHSLIQDGRLGENEKDGLVVNHYVNGSGSNYRQLGWHTDGLRDIFLHRRLPGPMLNVGVYLDDSPREIGGLRLIPGSHKQGLLRMMFGKAYFLDNRPDPREICLEAKAGDLTVHDGRLWHRVARSPLTGEASRRRVMYVPIINGPYEPKHDQSPVPIYHRLSRLVG
jgi:ectoine hydroxylase-related dioxygenase (phytanoyl-CoA dioxygenase family)